MPADHSLQIAVLVGGPSSEHYLSQLSGQTVLANANTDRYTCTLLNWSLEGWVDESVPGQPEQVAKRHANILAAFAEPKRFDIVVNMLHGEIECDGRLQGMFELIGLPFTGNDRLSSLKGMNKVISKTIVRAAGFLTADWFAFSRADITSGRVNIAEKARLFGYPLVVKASTGGASNSTLLVESEAELHAAIDTLSLVYDELYLECFLNGLEYTASVFGGAGERRAITLPVARITYEGKIFDAATKKAGRYDVVIPSGLSASDELKLSQMAEQIHADFRFSAFSRVDFRFSDGQPYFLEVNTHPGFATNSLVPLMLNAGGIALETAIDWLIETELSQCASSVTAK
jgi:D-alanine-D-alanine ligase